MKRVSRFGPAFFLLLLTHAVAAQTPPPPVETREQIEKQIRDAFIGKRVTLRHFYSGKKLEYNAQGELTNGWSGIWTADGVVQIRKVKLKNESLEFEAERLVVVFKGNTGKPQFLRSNQKATISLPVPLGISSLEFGSLLSKVFILEMEELWTYLPDYARLRIEEPGKSQVVVQSIGIFPKDLVLVPKSAPSEQKSVAPDEAAVPPGHSRLKRRDGTFITVSKDRLKPPKPIYAPPPEYSDAAQAAHFQGAVVVSMFVTEQGRTEELAVVRPLGAGLDEQAILILQQWRFHPATLDGKPVSMLINVELNFNLF